MNKPLSERRMLAFLNTLLILLPALLLFLFLVALTPRHTPDVPLTYTLHFHALRGEYAGNVQVGDPLLDAVGKRELGEVVALTCAPAMTESYDRTAGKIRRVPYPHYVSVTLTVRARARVVDGGYQIGPFLLFRGKRVHVRLPHLTASGYCTAISLEHP